MVFSSPLPLLLLPLLLLLLTTTTADTSSAAAAAPSTGNTTIYDILPLFGLPPGTFPDTVTSFSLSPDGDLSVNLTGPCYIDFDYLIYYAPTITGCLRYGSLSGLSGMQARRFLIWFNVDRIKVDLPPTNYIYFDVGWITRKLDADKFLTVHSCQSSCRLIQSVNQAFQWTKDLFANIFW